MAKYPTVEQQVTIGDLEQASSEINELREEMESWQQGLEGTNLENSEKFETISECASALESAAGDLEGIDQDFLEEVNDTITVTLYKNTKARWRRLANMTSILEGVQHLAEQKAEQLKEQADELEKEEASTEDAKLPDELRDQADETEECAREIEDVVNSLIDIEFPGMY